MQFRHKLFNFDAKFAPNLLQIFPNWTKKSAKYTLLQLMQIKCQKGAGTKMHKCWVEDFAKNYTFLTIIQTG